MDIVKILNLSEAEMETLVSAGKLLKSVSEALSSKTADVIGEDLKGLLTALAEVTDSILLKK